MLKLEPGLIGRAALRVDEEHTAPQIGNRWLGQFPLKKVVELSHHQRKPDPAVLLEICRDENVSPGETAYVGDSMARDMLMAKRAGAFSIWAKYGAFHRQEEYEKLVRVSHWTEQDVTRELELNKRAQDIEVAYILENTFSDIMHVLGHSVQPIIANR